MNSCLPDQKTTDQGTAGVNSESFQQAERRAIAAANPSVSESVKVITYRSPERSALTTWIKHGAAAI